MTVRVAVPVVSARIRVHVDVGIHWSPVDRLILWALSQTPRTATQLAKEANLPPRLVNDIIAKLMLFGWTEVAPDRFAFRATTAGTRVLHVPDGLPSLADPQSRIVRATFEPFELQVFTGSEVWTRSKRDIEAIAQDHEVRWLELAGPRPPLRFETLAAGAQKCLREDEEFLNMSSDGFELFDSYLLVAAHHDQLEGLPASAPAKLVEAVRAVTAEKERRLFAIAARSDCPSPTVMIDDVVLDETDIITDGPRHRELLSEILNAASHRVIIHSTFLNAKLFPGVQKDLRAAALNGAAIDIFYGADKDESTRKNNHLAALEINNIIRSDPVLRQQVTMHLASTRSHAKLLLADRGSPDSFVAVVGSCNWLSTPYRRIEASVILRDNRVAGVVARELTELCFTAAPRCDLIGKLSALARRLEKAPSPKGSASVGLVRGDDHAFMMTQAREQAKEIIWVAGDRFGKVAEARTLIPMMEAGSRGVRGRVLYSRKVVPVTQEDMADLAVEVALKGIELTEVPERVLHGKLLLWDDDHLVITSLNWSSAGTRADNPWGEIGIYVHQPQIARRIREQLELSISDTSQHRSAQTSARRNRNR